MGDPIFQLAYLSKRHEHVTDEDIVDGIVLPAITKNRELGITGCLWFDEKYFFQVLEGAKDAVEPLFEVIREDHRHASVTHILTEDTGERRFERFGMRAISSDAARSMPELIGLFVEGKSHEEDTSTNWWSPLARIVLGSDRSKTRSDQEPPLARRVIDELAGWSDVTPV
ncbi:MAG: BLUF domain-containing protein [Phycisphaerales bacterium]